MSLLALPATHSRGEETMDAELQEAAELLLAEGLTLGVMESCLADEPHVPLSDLKQWQHMAEGGGLPFVTRPDFYASELQVVSVGRVPEESAL